MVCESDQVFVKQQRSKNVTSRLVQIYSESLLMLASVVCVISDLME